MEDDREHTNRKAPSAKQIASPLRVNPNLVPKGCAPKNRNQKYEPLKNSKQSSVSNAKKSKISETPD